MKYKKVFAVGYNKSGTTSLHALFESKGFMCYHGTDWRNSLDITLLNAFDCFSDGPPKDYNIDGPPEDITKLDSLFPGSKFILQVRDLESWVYSRLAHLEREREAKITHSLPGWNISRYAIKGWIKRRNAYHLAVLSYFSERPSDLLVINFIRDESAATKVCKFLGFDGNYIRPKKNYNPRKGPHYKHVRILRRCIRKLRIPENELKNDIYCPSLESNKAHRRFSPDSSMI